MGVIDLCYTTETLEISLFLQNSIMVELKSAGLPRFSTSKIRTFKEKKRRFSSNL